MEFGDQHAFERWQESPDLMLWCDFESAAKDTERELLRNYLDINELALDDSQRERHPPKLEWFDDYYFLLLKGFTAETDSLDFGVVHISFFVGSRFIITRHDLVSPSINQIWSEMEKGKLDPARGTNHICYRIVRTIINRYTPIILNLEKKLDEMEELMLHKPRDEILADLISYNSQLRKLRRIFGYQASVLSELANWAATEVELGTAAQHEFNDVYEHMDRLLSLSGVLQELTVDLINGYISVSAHRLNRIMKVLTITTVIFVPLTFLAGIYGMNFTNMPELQSEHGYFVVLAAMGGITIALLALFRFIKWL
jgi:magnesium transporter